jgi:hypothetical protein
MRYMIPVGRILFALIFISAAPRHFTHEGIQHATYLGATSCQSSSPDVRDIGPPRRLKE